MNSIKMIVADLDGTLLRRDESIGDYTVDIFRRVHARGILIAFATARSYESSQEYRNVLNPDGDIVTGGCLVFASTRLLRVHYLPEPQGSRLLAELDAYTPKKRVSARSLNERYSNITVAGDVCVDFQSPLPEKLLHCSCRTDDHVFMKSIASRYPEFTFLKSSGIDLYDINPKNATKLNGIKAITEHFSFSLSEVIAFGDSYSDIEMLRGCGIGVAVNNAIDECKDVANSICGDCDNEGVARWIEENVLSA